MRDCPGHSGTIGNYVSSRRCSLIASYSKTTSLRSKGKWVAGARRIVRLLLQLEFTVAQGKGWFIVRLRSVNAQHACVVPMLCAFIYAIQCSVLARMHVKEGGRQYYVKRAP